MTAIEIHIIERLKQLPPTRVSQVMDFVEFLAAREELAATAARVGDAAKTDSHGELAATQVTRGAYLPARAKTND
jgi:hypothetical protein